MALLHTGFFSQALGMCVSCDVILPQFSSSLIGMKTAEEMVRQWLPLRFDPSSASAAKVAHLRQIEAEN